MTASDAEELIAQVQSLQTMLIDVGTGNRRIQDTEGEYTQLRSQVSQKLRGFNIADGNSFLSLWDWYNYWKQNGLETYQSRRNYITASTNLFWRQLSKEICGKQTTLPKNLFPCDTAMQRPPVMLKSRYGKTRPMNFGALYST